MNNRLSLLVSFLLVLLIGTLLGCASKPSRGGCGTGGGPPAYAITASDTDLIPGWTTTLDPAEADKPAKQVMLEVRYVLFPRQDEGKPLDWQQDVGKKDWRRTLNKLGCEVVQEPRILTQIGRNLTHTAWWQYRDESIVCLLTIEEHGPNELLLNLDVGFGKKVKLKTTGKLLDGIKRESVATRLITKSGETVAVELPDGMLIAITPYLVPDPIAEAKKRKQAPAISSAVTES